MSLSVSERVLTRKEVAAILGVHPKTILRFERNEPGFPQRIKLTNNKVGWKGSELQEWIDSRPREACKYGRQPVA